jgi:glucoamylase
MTLEKTWIMAMEKFANEGGMITEQLWDADDLPDGSMKRSRPTGAAMPLCWSHAKYVTLVRSRRERICFERVQPSFQRYVVNLMPSRHEIWSFRHQLRQMPHQKILRIIVAAEATTVWSANHWATANKSDTMNRTGLNLWFADLATKDLPDGSVVEFTFFWKHSALGRQELADRYRTALSPSLDL